MTRLRTCRTVPGEDLIVHEYDADTLTIKFGDLVLSGSEITLGVQSVDRVKCFRCNHIQPTHSPDGCQVLTADNGVCGCVYPRPRAPYVSARKRRRIRRRGYGAWLTHTLQIVNLQRMPDESYTEMRRRWLEQVGPPHVMLRGIRLTGTLSV